MTATRQTLLAAYCRARSKAYPALAFALVLPALGVATTPAAAETTRLKAQYTISISGLTIGRATVDGRFNATQYAATVSGSTSGISRFVSDARATLAGNGRLSGTRTVPAGYHLKTTESGFTTAVDMSMRGGSITRLDAFPDLVEASDRVPVRSSHKRNVVDPIGAFIVSVGKRGAVDGRKACQRTVRVFDGWQRFDVRLSYKHTKDVRGGAGSYQGAVIVCGARYVPIAGHRPGRESIQYMSKNTRLEVWLAPVKGTTVMVPYHILIGTKVGDLIVSARQFAVTKIEKQASVR